VIVPFATPADVDRALGRAVRHLRRGGLLAHPTETVYGLGSRACGPELDRLSSLKGRGRKPVLLLVSERAMAAQWGLRFPETAARLADAFWPGPLTLVLPPGSVAVPAELRGAGGGVAVRHTAHRGAARLVAAVGEPLTSTSANRAGAGVAESARAVVTHFPEACRAGLLLVLDGGELGNRPPSSVVDCTGPQPRLVREGAIARERLGQIVPLAP